jgi:hypothetical protein
MQLSLTGSEAKGLNASENKMNMILSGMNWRIQHPLVKE